MSVQDMIKKSVLESGMFSQYDIPKILAALAVALILGSVIYLVYQKFYVGVIFSRTESEPVSCLRSQLLM